MQDISSGYLGAERSYCCLEGKTIPSPFSGSLMDGDANHWGWQPIYDEIKPCWRRYRDASVSADASQIVPES
jgi:hypothetical protein